MYYNFYVLGYSRYISTSLIVLFRNLKNALNKMSNRIRNNEKLTSSYSFAILFDT